MSILEKKEKNLNELINKLNILTSTYSQPGKTENIASEKEEILRQKASMEKKNQELMREHRYLKEKITSLQNALNKKSTMEDQFKQDIEDLSQETENLVSEINKWQT